MAEDHIDEFLEAYTTLCEDFGLIICSADPFCGSIVKEADLDELEASISNMRENMRLEDMRKETEEND